MGMLSLQEISDRMEIQDLLVRYSHAVDTMNWDLYEEVFTPDAFIDYSCFGGPKGGLKEIRAFLESVMPNFKSFQHMIANTMLEFVDENTVKARTICHNPMVIGLGGDKEHVFYCGLWYVDEIVRTDDGWRIRSRVEERSYTHNQPEAPGAPAEA